MLEYKTSDVPVNPEGNAYPEFSIWAIRLIVAKKRPSVGVLEVVSADVAVEDVLEYSRNTWQ